MELVSDLNETAVSPGMGTTSLIKCFLISNFRLYVRAIYTAPRGSLRLV